MSKIKIKFTGSGFARPVMAGDGGGDEGGAPSAEEFAKLQSQIEAMNSSLTSVAAERDLLKAKHDEAEKHRKAAETKAKKDLEDAMRKSGDVEALENSWNEKYTTAISEREAIIAERDQIIRDVTVGATATALAAELAIDGSAKALEPHIRPRLINEIVNGKSVVKVLGVDGKPSAQTLDELKAEIQGIGFLAPIIKGSDASGGGSGGNGGGQNPKGKVMKRSAYDQLTPPEQAHFIRVEKGAVVD